MSDTNSYLFDWQGEDNSILYNTRSLSGLTTPLKNILNKTRLKSHFLIASSGTSQTEASDTKWIALSKSALLTSAASVNKKIESNKNDIWLNVLPDFHVGGLSIWARAYLSQAKVIKPPLNSTSTTPTSWNARFFYDDCINLRPTLCSLVPTQLFDLVELNLKAPPSLRAVFIGGSALPKTTFEKALSLDWKLILTYGMTETSSQVAATDINGEELFLLPHIEAKSEERALLFKGDSLFTGYLTLEGLIDPKINGWFKSNDFGEINTVSDRTQLIFLGRASEHIKIGGELVSLTKLDRILDQVRNEIDFKDTIAIVALSDQRLENIIGIAIENTTSQNQNKLDLLVEHFNDRVLPFEKIRAIKQVKNMPFNELGKLQRAKLAEILNK